MQRNRGEACPRRGLAAGLASLHFTVSLPSPAVKVEVARRGRVGRRAEKVQGVSSRADRRFADVNARDGLGPQGHPR